ncbi:MAG: hypothetical protein M1825_004550 [Sarcosagium campestre]|nr:MAG: hypothetical protein M1825_004550 [Sarcosagium campestre]
MRRDQPTLDQWSKSEPKAPRDSPAIRRSDPDLKRKRTPASGLIHEAAESWQDKDEPGRKRKRSRSVPGATRRKNINNSKKSNNSNDSNNSKCKGNGNGNIGSNVPLIHWILQGNWPRDYLSPDGNTSQQMLIRKRSNPSLQNRPSEDSSTSVREGKNPAVKSRRYVQLLALASIYMTDNDDVATTDTCKALCQTLLNREQTVPQDSLFNDDIFKRICDRVENRNEARVMRDLTPLLVPSAEILHVQGAVQLKQLVENVNESWSNSIPLVAGPRPQPDFSVGLKPTAFRPEQRKRLAPFIGGWDTASRLVATDEMYFPFLTAEVKCGNEALNIADRQNAHSASVAANAVVSLYRAVSRQRELHRKLLTFSLSHDHEAVRIFGYYASTDTDQTSFYRHPVIKFDFTSQEGRDRWTAYRFTRNVYDVFYPLHLERILAVLDQLPDPAVFAVPPLSQSQSQASTAGAGSVEQEDGESAPSFSQQSQPGIVPLSSSQAEEPVFKKPRAKGAR